MAVARARSSRRQLPITGFAHKAGVVGDGRVAAGGVLTACDMPASWRSHASHGRAAVRQRSMALMTFSWSRLTWPRLASRQAGPCSRKMSATSSMAETWTPATTRARRPCAWTASARKPSSLLIRRHNRARCQAEIPLSAPSEIVEPLLTSINLQNAPVEPRCSPDTLAQEPRQQLADLTIVVGHRAIARFANLLAPLDRADWARRIVEDWQESAPRALGSARCMGRTRGAKPASSASQHSGVSVAMWFLEFLALRSKM